MEKKRKGKIQTALRYSLDSSVVVSYFKGEIGEDLICSSSSESALPFIALTEIYYIAAKNFGEDFAEKSVHTLKSWNMQILYPNDLTLIIAGKLVRKYGLGIADSFIAALSLENNLTLLTKDYDFKKLGNILKIKLVR